MLAYWSQTRKLSIVESQVSFLTGISPSSDRLMHIVPPV